MLSRVLGMVRDITFAALFGAGGAQDAFVVAFKIPNFLRRLFAEGAFNQAFIPVLSEYRAAEGDDSVRRLISAVQLYLSGIVGVVTLVAVMASPWLAWLFAPGFHDDGEKLALVAEFLRLTFPYLWFISLTALASSVLNSYQRFAAPALTPVLLNFCLIGSALFLRDQFVVQQTALAFGVLIAGIVQWLFLWPSLLRTGVWQPWLLVAQHPGVKKIFVLMLPGLFAVSVSQINLLLDTVLASLLEDGSVTWLYYSDRLTELPLGVIGIAIATVLLPKLSALRAEDEVKKFQSTLAWATTIVCLIGLPAAMALLILPDVLIHLLFEYREFSVEDTQRTAQSLAAYALGLPAFMLIKILAPAYFAHQDTKTPVKIGIQAMAANMVLNLALIIPMAHVGLALATSLSAWLNATLLAVSLRGTGRLPKARVIYPSILRIMLATVAMGLVLWLCSDMVLFEPVQSIAGRVWRAALLVGVGLVIYPLMLFILGARLSLIRQPT